MRNSRLLNTITNSKTLPKQFRVSDVNKFCNNILIKSESFLSKHCDENPNNNTIYFIRVGIGLYTLK